MRTSRISRHIDLHFAEGWELSMAGLLLPGKPKIRLVKPLANDESS